MTGFFITGTDTDVGKTVAAAYVCLQLKANYWKPVQSGLTEGMSDRDTVQQLTGFADDRFFPCRHQLAAPLSPHEAARLEGQKIELDDFSLPHSNKPLVVEGAGGVLVPLNDTALMIDLMGRLGLPVIVTARSTLGTINHTLLTLAALRQANLTIAGVILNGPPNAANKQAIEFYGQTSILAELPSFDRLSKEALFATPLLTPADSWTAQL